MYNNREFKGESLLNLVDNYVLVDIETSGFSPKFNEIIEIGAIKVQNNKIIDSFNYLIYTENELNSVITDLTGITNEMLATEGKKIKFVLSEFLNFIGDNVLIAHNANFDINFLYDNCLKYLNKPLSNNFIDTLRISKKMYPDLENHKLSTIANHLNIDYSNAHRSLKDVEITFKIYCNLQYRFEHYYELRQTELEKIITPSDSFNNKKVVIKTVLKNLDYKLIKNILAKQNTKVYDIFYPSVDYLIINDTKYNKYNLSKINDLYEGNWMYKAKLLENSGSLKVLSESNFCKLYNIPFNKKITLSKEHQSAKNVLPSTDSFDETHILYNKYCVFTGILEKMDRKSAMQIVVNLGGFCQDTVTSKTNYLILGNNDYCKAIKDGKSSKHKKAEILQLKGYDIEIIPEDLFYEMILED